MKGSLRPPSCCASRRAVGSAMPERFWNKNSARSPPAKARRRSSAAARSAGLALSCGSGGRYFAPGKRARLKFSCREEIFSAPVMTPPSVSTRLEYLPMISACRVRCARENSPVQSKEKERMRSNPSRRTAVSVAPERCLRSSIQKLGATSGAVRGASHTQARAKEACVLSSSLRVFPPAYSKMSTSSREGWMILLTFPPASIAFNSRATCRSVNASCGMRASGVFFLLYQKRGKKANAARQKGKSARPRSGTKRVHARCDGKLFSRAA